MITLSRRRLRKHGWLASGQTFSPQPLKQRKVGRYYDNTSLCNGLSEPRFWKWFDGLEVSDRDIINYAANARHATDMALAIWNRTQVAVQDAPPT